MHTAQLHFFLIN